MSTEEKLSNSHVLPSEKTITHAMKFAINEDKPIMMDYWIDSHKGTVYLCQKTSGEKLLVRDDDEYTSHIVKLGRSGDELLVLTENSIYIVSKNIPIREVE